MEKYGLIGYPLRHSFSIGYFNEKFRSEGINAEYVNFEIPNINDFMEVIEENPNLCGLNVTIPYKEQVIPFLNELDRDTAKIGAVNVIKIIRQPKGKVKLVGYNSDIIGFTQSIQPLLQPQHKKALILGTGGASKAVYHGLKNLGIESVFVSRTHKTDDMLTYEELTPQLIQLIDQTKHDESLTEAQKQDEISLHMMGYIKSCTNEIIIEVLAEILGLEDSQ
jgi:shikimate dehydrogenase